MSIPTITKSHISKQAKKTFEELEILYILVHAAPHDDDKADRLRELLYAKRYVQEHIEKED